MALLERLQILVDADTKGASREFEQIGRTADKELGKAESRIDKTSKRLQSMGSSVAIGGAIVVGGMAALAKASDDADKQVLKLENSIKNSDQAFRKQGASLTSLAGDLQKVTAADADATIGAQSLMVQFGMTEAQVMSLTPLIVDLSRKMGIDMDTAAKAVGKSVDGSAGALKKMGISVDEAAFKTDSFQATFDALNQTVGGFARNEGKTFSGQIEILKNNLGDLGEAVGSGAAGVLGSLTGQAASAAGALNELNPGILTAAGGIATTAGLVATVGGGFAFATGKAMELRNSLTKVGEDGTRSLTNVGKAASAIAIIGAIAGTIETVAQTLNAVNRIDEKLASATDKFRGSLEGTNDELARTFGELVEIEDKSANFSDIWEGFGAEITIGRFDADVEEATRAFDNMLDSFGPDVAQKVVDGLEMQNSALDKNGEQYRRNAEWIEGSQKKIDDRRKATVQAAIAEKAATRAQEDAIAAEEKRQVTTDSLIRGTKEYIDALGRMFKAYDDNTRKAESFGKALEKTSATDDAVTSAIGLANAGKELTETLGAIPGKLDIGGIALGKFSEEAMDAIGNVEQFGGAASGMLGSLIKNGADDSMVMALADQLRAQLVEALVAAKVPPENIPEYIGLAGLDEQQIKVALTLANKEQFANEVLFLLQLYQTELDKAPLSIRSALEDAQVTGDTEGAKAIIDAYTAALAGDPVRLQAAIDASPETVGPQLLALQEAFASGSIDLPANFKYPDGYESAEDYVASVIDGVIANNPTIPLTADPSQAASTIAAWRSDEERKNLKLALEVDATAANGTWDGIKDNFRTTLALIAFGWNNLKFPSFTVPAIDIPGFGKIGGGKIGGWDLPDITIPKFAEGGRPTMDQLALVNERGAEMFVPDQPGFVMTSADSKALIAGVSDLVSSPAAPTQVAPRDDKAQAELVEAVRQLTARIADKGDTITIYEATSATATAEELLRVRRANSFLAGAA